MAKEFEKRGWKIAAKDFFAITQTDFYPLLSKYKKDDVAVLFSTSTAAPITSAFIKQTREVGLKALVIVDGQGWSGEWYQMSGAASDGVLDMIPHLTTKEAKAWAEDFEKRFKTKPSPSAGGLSYDGTNFFIKILKRTLEKYGKLSCARGPTRWSRRRAQAQARHPRQTARPRCRRPQPGPSHPGHRPSPPPRPEFRSTGPRVGSGHSAVPQAGDSARAPGPVSVRELLDSAELALPDTLEFGFRQYTTKFTPDYVAQPTIGYSYSNFGRGFYGGAAFSLSDILGNKSLIFAGAINGRPQEAQVLAPYVNQGQRLNWATGFQQAPYYFYGPYTPPTPAPLPGGGPDSALRETVTLQRNVIRELFLETAYPFSRFSRAEFSLRTVGIQEDLLLQDNYYDFSGFYLGSTETRTVGLGSTYFVQPSVALEHDKTLFAYDGPFAGRRDRLQVSPSFGEWNFVAALADVREYLYARPFTLALRGMLFSRFGRDADRFPVFMGTTELIRGYTYGSIVDHECAVSQGGCNTLSALTGSKVAVANAEIRFPLFQWLALGFLPVALPPIEGALFYDAGIAWNEGQTVKFSASPNDNPLYVRTPLRSWGGSARINALGFLILRIDYTKPLDRLYDKAYWTVSFGPTY